MIKDLENRELFKDYCNVVFDTRTDSQDRTKWLEQRCNSVGGSEIGKIIGLSKYGSALTTYNEKKGLVEKFKGNVHTIFGNRMEDTIKEWLQEDFLKKEEVNIEIWNYPYMLTSKVHNYFSANLDGIAKLGKDYCFYKNLDTGEINVIPPNELIGIEVKTASEFLSKMWAGEEIPDEYYTQVQWYMGVTGLNYFLIVYLIGKAVKWKVVQRNDTDIKLLFDCGINFWNENILKDVAPDPIGLDVETKQILEQQELENTETILAEENITKLHQVKQDIKDLQKQEKKLTQLIYLAMQNHKKANDGIFKLSRWTVTKDKFDMKKFKAERPDTYQNYLNGTSEYVSSRITKIKK